VTTRYTDLPPNLAFFEGRVGVVKRVTHTEYSGACPECGGDDRFRMMDDPIKPRGWCRKCDVKLYPNSFDGWVPPDAQEIARRADASRRALEREIARAQDLLAELKQAEPWIRYHAQLNAEAKMIWTYRGINNFFQDYWQLGFSSDKPWGQSLTIPVWQVGWDVANIKHRLLVPDGKGKYRSHTAGLPARSFVSAPDIKGGHALAVEGEIKAMAVYALLEDPDLQVVGIPSKNPSDASIEVFDSYDCVTLSLDPDVSPSEVRKIADRIGRSRVRYMPLPGTEKIDDLITAGVLDAPALRRYVQGAHK